jgi:biopolymer transport protein ExbB
MFLIQKGGLVMWPLLATAVWALYLILERLFYYHVILRPQRKFLALITDADSLPDEPGRSRILKSLAVARKEKRLNTELALQTAEHDLEDAEYGLPSLGMIGQAAPLLGLLGSVAGLVSAFQRIDALAGVVNPSDLAGGIWQALLTTIVGLFIAIPALAAHSYFQSRLLRFERELHYLIARMADDFQRRGWEVI